MTKVIFIEPDGKQTEIDAKDGASIMQTAVENNVGSVIGECGGSMACATCVGVSGPRSCTVNIRSAYVAALATVPIRFGRPASTQASTSCTPPTARAT